jgi:hypothetical protein
MCSGSQYSWLFLCLTWYIFVHVGVEARYSPFVANLQYLLER